MHEEGQLQQNQGRTSNQQQTGRKLLQEHHALATVATGKKDQYGTRGDAGTELGGLWLGVTV